MLVVVLFYIAALQNHRVQCNTDMLEVVLLHTAALRSQNKNMTDMAAEFPVPYPCSADSDMTTQTDTTAGAAGICLDLGRCSTKSDNITQHR